MSVAFLDLAAPYAELRAEIDEAVTRVLASGWYLVGEELARFEAEFAAYCGTRHCVGVGNGGDAIALVLRALGVGPGDEVIVPSHTFIASWLGVTAAGAVPVPVEPDETTATIDPAAVEAAITPRTRAILPVHLYGHPAELDALRAIADRHGLAVVEDAAQAHGARHRGRRIGAGSHAVTFSFYPGKNLGALGDAGAVVTDDPALAERLRSLRNYGSLRKYHHDERSGSSRLDELQAAVLRVKLRHLDGWNARRAAVADRYRTGLADLLGLTLPGTADWADPVWHLYVVRHPERDRVQELLTAAGIATLIHYPVPVHLSGAFADAGRPRGSMPVAERLAATVLSLPMGPHLDDVAADAVVAATRDAALHADGVRSR